LCPKVQFNVRRFRASRPGFPELRVSVFSNIAFYTKHRRGVCYNNYTFFQRKRRVKSLLINLSCPLFSDLCLVARDSILDARFYRATGHERRATVLPLLRLIGYYLMISPKEFLPDANPFDMRMLSRHHYERFVLRQVERVNGPIKLPAKIPEDAHVKSAQQI
jgi:hypothetical protein